MSIQAITIAGKPLRLFSQADAAFGAELSDYPPIDTLPQDYQRCRAEGCIIAESLFFSGGKLADHGRTLKPEIDSSQFFAALQAMLSSFAPKHEHKIAVCGALIDECTDKTKGTPA